MLADLPGSKHLPYASISRTTASHTITALSASKAWNLAGLVAQLILSNDADAGHWNEVGQFIGHGASIVRGIIANCVAYAEGKPWLDEVIAYLNGNPASSAICSQSIFPKLGTSSPREPTWPSSISGATRCLKTWEPSFAKAKVAVVDGPACGEAGRVHPLQLRNVPRNHAPRDQPDGLRCEHRRIVESGPVPARCRRPQAAGRVNNKGVLPFPAQNQPDHPRLEKKRRVQGLYNLRPAIWPAPRALLFRQHRVE